MVQFVRISCLNLLISLFWILCGCSAFYHYYPVSVQTIDAETKLPIQGAEVQISYPLASPYKAPYVATAATKEDGFAELKAATQDQHLALMEVSAKGYMKDNEDLPLAEIEKSSLQSGGDGKQVTFVKQLYSEPHPEVTLLFPDGAIGLVKLKIEIQEDFVYPVGKRAFQYSIEISDHASITGPPLLTRAAPAGFTARYASGTVINSKAVDPEVGFWWIGREDDKEVYFVGSPLACRLYRKKHPQLLAGDEPRSPAKKGRHHRDS